MNEAGKAREVRVPASSRRPVLSCPWKNLSRACLTPGECPKRAAAGEFGTKPPEVGATQQEHELGKERPHNGNYYSWPPF